MEPTIWNKIAPIDTPSAESEQLDTVVVSVRLWSLSAICQWTRSRRREGGRWRGACCRSTNAEPCWVKYAEANIVLLLWTFDSFRGTELDVVGNNTAGGEKVYKSEHTTHRINPSRYPQVCTSYQPGTLFQCHQMCHLISAMASMELLGKENQFCAPLIP